MIYSFSKTIPRSSKPTTFNPVSIGRSSVFKGGNSNCHTRHAEQHALSQVKNTKKTIVVSIRYSEDEYSNSRPCTHCANAMYREGVKKIVFYEKEDWRIETIHECIMNPKTHPSKLQRVFK